MHAYIHACIRTCQQSEDEMARGAEGDEKESEGCPQRDAEEGDADAKQVLCVCLRACASVSECLCACIVDSA